MIYARLMLQGLTSIWLGAIVTPFLKFHWSWLSLIAGYLLGVVISAVTIYWSVRRLGRVPVRRLLAGQADDATTHAGVRKAWPRYAAGLLIVLALGLATLATRLGGEAQAGAFVGAGACVLTGLLLLIGDWLRRPTAAGSSPSLSLARLSASSAARNPGRSLTTIALIGTASFLIIALSSFRLDPSQSGAGGFDLVAECSLPIYVDLTSQEGREAYLLDDAQILSGAAVLSLRVKPGDDASCNNLFKANRPRVLGVTDRMIDYFDDDQVQPFAFADSAASSEQPSANPWRLLEQEDSSVVPVILDKNTAMFSLGMYGGIGEEKEFDYEGYGTIRFRVVGLLSNSILQGNLLIFESHFQRMFSDVTGYEYFLIRSPAGQQAEVASLLEETFSDQGFDARPTEEVLRGLLAVQNTYLSTFQSLGALGLLLGTFGLATVQLRNVIERRGELALMRASGFRVARLARLVMTENVLLLLGGLATGTIAALLAVLPHMFFGAASVPLIELAIMLTIVLVVGILAGLAAVRATVRAPLVPALRGD